MTVTSWYNIQYVHGLHSPIHLKWWVCGALVNNLKRCSRQGGKTAGCFQSMRRRRLETDFFFKEWCDHLIRWSFLPQKNPIDSFDCETDGWCSYWLWYKLFPTCGRGWVIVCRGPWVDVCNMAAYIYILYIFMSMMPYSQIGCQYTCEAHATNQHMSIEL